MMKCCTKTPKARLLITLFLIFGSTSLLASGPAVCERSPGAILSETLFGDVTVRGVGGFGIFVALDKDFDGVAEEVFIQQTGDASGESLTIKRAFILHQSDFLLVSPVVGDSAASTTVILLTNDRLTQFQEELQAQLLAATNSPTVVYRGEGDLRRVSGQWSIRYYSQLEGENFDKFEFEEFIMATIHGIGTLELDSMTRYSAPAKVGCSGLGCNGMDPYQTGCANGAYIARYKSVDYNLGVELWYSPSCNTNWSRSISYNGPRPLWTRVDGYEIYPGGYFWYQWPQYGPVNGYEWVWSDMKYCPAPCIARACDLSGDWTYWICTDWA